MATRIEWADEVWNPATGCEAASPGCANCYARRFAHRLGGRAGYPEDEPFRVTLHPQRLKQPLRWRRPRRVFVCSMGDLFHAAVPSNFIADVWRTMEAATAHTFCVLTKRPERMRAWLQAASEARWRHWPLPNVWLGVSVENSLMATERIPELLATPAALHFVSFEPLLEAIDFIGWADEHHLCSCGAVNPVDCCDVLGAAPGNLFCPCGREEPANIRRVGWVVAGAETGPHARKCSLEWLRSLRDECRAAGVPFFLKQADRFGWRYLDGRLHDDVPSRDWFRSLRDQLHNGLGSMG